ncbi:hypothetical protein FGO68_gene11701 [Halteria grandinella]|uniref:Uncharacterized protein n=1 Tax=Halteria grandinella TaxID=5974 RepID=A0A8J8NTW9_HALGN|nr:hypothetical protein FGO68_gene11701 [Halteria grandinella]
MLINSIEKLSPPDTKLELITEKMNQMRALYQALYLGICTNLSKQCEDEIFESVKRETKHISYEISDVIEKYIGWVSMVQDPLSLILNKGVKPILLIDPQSHYLQYESVFQFKKYRHMAPIDRGTVYTCNYERPSLSKEVYQQFTVVNMGKFINDQELKMVNQK